MRLFEIHSYEVLDVSLARIPVAVGHEKSSPRRKGGERDDVGCLLNPYCGQITLIIEVLLFIGIQKVAPHTRKADDKIQLQYNPPKIGLMGCASKQGSGKSVLMQNIILGIAATNTREQAGIVLIDPKQGVDYFLFDGLPHIRDGIIDDQDQALSRLQALVLEMDSRYTKFKNAR
jgi:hypothetical protein